MLVGHVEYDDKELISIGDGTSNAETQLTLSVSYTLNSFNKGSTNVYVPGISFT
jgi:hypothetical protein